jgi:predicted DNA-binding transcriptional regulator AlpA
MNPIIRSKLKVKDAADYTGLSISTLNKMRLTGDGPIFIKAGRAVIYDAADLDAWLAARRRRSTSDQGRA